MRQCVAITILLCAGCSGVDSTTTGAEVEEACGDFLTHTQIESAITTYEAFRDEGNSKFDGVALGTHVCAPPTPLEFPSSSQCTLCNTTIVDFVWDQ